MFKERPPKSLFLAGLMMSEQPPSPSLATTYPQWSALILLAEDSPINQEVGTSAPLHEPTPQPLVPANSTSSVSSAIDLAILDQRRELGQRCGQDILGNIVQMYLRQPPEWLGTFQDALTANHAEGVCQTAHVFKTSSGNVGAITLVELCQLLEQQGAAKDLSEGTLILSKIETEYESVRYALPALLQEPPG